MKRPQTAQTRLAPGPTTGAIRPLLESYRGHFEVVAHVLFFDSFFMEGVGEGTRLGLDTARRSVTGRHVYTRVGSRPGKTRFVDRLPVDLSKRDGG